jgi:hypothetical protein
MAPIRERIAEIILSNAGYRKVFFANAMCHGMAIAMAMANNAAEFAEVIEYKLYCEQLLDEFHNQGIFS